MCTPGERTSCGWGWRWWWWWVRGNVGSGRRLKVESRWAAVRQSMAWRMREGWGIVLTTTVIAFTRQDCMCVYVFFFSFYWSSLIFILPFVHNFPLFLFFHTDCKFRGQTIEQEAQQAGVQHKFDLMRVFAFGHERQFVCVYELEQRKELIDSLFGRQCIVRAKSGAQIRAVESSSRRLFLIFGSSGRQTWKRWWFYNQKEFLFLTRDPSPQYTWAKRETEITFSSSSLIFSFIVLGCGA